MTHPGPDPDPDSFGEQADPGVARAKYLACQRQARILGRSTASIQTLYALECFLRRLTMTDYASHFLLKGGVLLAAYDVRRPTKDVDMQVVDHPLNADYLRRVVRAVAAVQVSDGMTYLNDNITIDAIREGTDDLYVGHRVRFAATLASARIRMQLDISTGDPVSPAPALVTIPGLLPGEQFTIMGHPLENVIAEKTITMLQRGAANTRWRDFLDVYALSCRQPFEADTVHESLQRVAASRQVTLAGIRGLAEEFDTQAQAKYARWRGDLAMDRTARDDLCQPLLSDQVRAVAAFIDPIMVGSVPGERWSPAVQRWM